MYSLRRYINPDPKRSSLKSSFFSLNIFVTHLSESFFRTPLAVLVHTCRGEKEKTFLCFKQNNCSMLFIVVWPIYANRYGPYVVS